MSRPIIQVDQKVGLVKGLPLSFQHLFAMFGASILVPMLFGINPAIVLLMNGIGTMLYLVICKGKAPAFLGSSFAFLAPTFAVLAAMGGIAAGAFNYALGGYVVVGVSFMIVAVIIKFAGTKWIDVVLPPATMGPVVALIGLDLAGTAAKSAGLLPDAGAAMDVRVVTVSMITLAVAIFGNVLFRKFFAVIPILIAIVVGYLTAVAFGLVDLSGVAKAPIFALPNFTFPKFQLDMILIILPAALVVISEHIGHLIVTGNIIGKDLTKDPGLHRSLFSDGISTTLSGFMGSVPTTTYGENIGVMAITRVYSVWVIGGAAVLSSVLAFSGTLSAIIMSIPGAVMGGVSFLLYGVIAASGIRLIVEQKVDYSKAKNLCLTAVVLTVGVSGVKVPVGLASLSGMCLATIVGMALSLIFWILESLKLTNDFDSAK
jgi:uracil permease